jgi:hypothetical protein
MGRNSLPNAHRNGIKRLKLIEHALRALDVGGRLAQFQLHVDGFDAQAHLVVAAHNPRGGCDQSAKVLFEFLQ